MHKSFKYTAQWILIPYPAGWWPNHRSFSTFIWLFLLTFLNPLHQQPLLWVQLCSPKKLCWNPNSQYLGYDSTWKQGLFRSNQVTMRSWGWLIQYDWRPYKKGTFGDRGGQCEDSHVTMESEPGELYLWAKDAKDTKNLQKLGRGEEGVSPRAIKGNTALMPQAQTSSLQNYKRTHLCCLQPLSLWYLVTSALRSKYKHYLMQHIFYLFHLISPRDLSLWLLCLSA